MLCRMIHISFDLVKNDFTVGDNKFIDMCGASINDVTIFRKKGKKFSEKNDDA